MPQFRGIDGADASACRLPMSGSMLSLRVENAIEAAAGAMVLLGWTAGTVLIALRRRQATAGHLHTKRDTLRSRDLAADEQTRRSPATRGAGTRLASGES